MKTYRNEQYGFEIDIPENWSFHSEGMVIRPPVKDRSFVFKCGSNEAFNIQIGPLKPEPSLKQTEDNFARYAHEKGYTSLGMGRITVAGKEHVWARYYMGGGSWSKKYMIILNGIEYAITATCLDQKLLLEMEKAWDAVVVSFRLIAPAIKSAGPKREVSEQKNEIADIKPRHDLKSSKVARPSFEITKIMQMLSQPARLSDMPQRIEMCEQALAQVDRQTNPEIWAALELELGINLGKNPLGNRDENIEQSIHHFHKAQEVFTRQAYPDEWANIQTNLASDYRNRRRGKHDENMEMAIQLCQQALEAITRDALPEVQGSIHNNLANAYRDRIHGEKEENLEQAILHCQQALEVMTRQRNPHYWAIIQNNLANIYQDRTRGDHAENIEKSIYYFEQALEVFTRKVKPEDWAWTHSNLGVSYHRRVRGDQTENLELAIHHYKQALEFLTRENLPEKWATAQQNLGNAYLGRILGEKAVNLNQALDHYQHALDVFTHEAYPERWLLIQAGLASANKGFDSTYNEIADKHVAEARNVEPQVSLKIVSDIYEAEKETSRTGKDQEKQRTLTFSIISYILIAALAFLYIHSKVAVGVLLNLNGESSQSLSGWGHNIVILALYYGIGASICLLHLLGVLINRQILNQALTIFNLIERTMQVRDGQNETFGGIIFSDYTRSPTGVLDTLGLQLPNFIRALIKITFTFLSMGLLGPAMTFIVAAVVFVPQLILDYPVPILWQVGISSFWFYSCYRALLFWLAKRKGISKSGAKPDKKLNPSILPKQQEQNEKIRQGNSKIQAALHMFKAASFAESKQGNPAENLNKAIYHFQQALEALSRRENPDEWASTQNDLGEAYRNLSLLLDRAKNLDQAIFHYHQALEVVTRQADPDLWAAAHNNLGIAYANGASGDQAENVEQAISHCQQALEVYTRKAFPDDWAMTQNNLGSAYNKRLRGEQANNIEQAISCFQQALEVQTHQADRGQWAGTQTNLAQVYWVRPDGERAENLEQVITHAQQALEVYTREAYPQDWAVTHNRLGAIYQIRMRGDQAENLEQAIHHIELALTLFSRQAHPENWAKAQNSLALVFQNRKRGERAENIEKAISLFLQALQVYTRRDFPADWAVTQNYLAFAYEDRIRGNRADNIERAIGYFQQALEVFTRQTHPEQWAHTHTPLASAYEMRKIGKRDENLDQAIWHYQQALEVYTREAYPDQWAMGQIFLGITCIERKRGKLAEYTAQAIQYFQQAQQVFTRDKYPEEWARIQEGLAAAYNEAGLVGNPPMLSYPQFYNEESRQHPGKKCHLKLIYAYIPDFAVATNLLLVYQWEDKLSEDGAEKLRLRAVAYLSCAIYNAAQIAGIPCVISPIPNGLRPAWMIEGERSPVSLTLSDVDTSDRTLQMSIGPMMVSLDKMSVNKTHLKKLMEGFRDRFSEIIV